ncbi:chemotaxis protein CheA [Cohnella endophytica]|uniref:Chemotaxis protein CheA n=1 Tax=Cohnella endophytica TaxID=2419778 RepID=A0A494Y2K7_9BACL|nr:chemotaxis protein CheA [Cohnella endophytica]RKP54116.1 chemotaxis protein CheA [Cohnella endophytica]
MNVDQYLSIFIDESLEHLQSINANLLSLEQNPDDLDIVHSIFRSAHTLKGMSATMGYEDLASLTHQMENVLDRVRNKQLELEPYIIDELFKSNDALQAMVQDIVQGGTGRAEVAANLQSLKLIANGESREQHASGEEEKAELSHSPFDVDEYQYSVLIRSLEAGFGVYFTEVVIRGDSLLKAARAYMVFQLLEKHGEVIKSTPSVEEIEQEMFDRSFFVVIISKVNEDVLQTMIGNVSEIEAVKVSRITRGTLIELKGQHQETTIAKEIPAETAKPARIGNLDKPVTAVNVSAAVATASRSIRVDLDRLDALINLFGEMLIDRVRLEQLASEIRRTELTETVEHMSLVSNSLQDIVMKLRMVPIDTVFNRFPRMIRDAAKTLDKKIELIMTGVETELDRTVADEIGDPLVHLLRNSADHGIERTADRIAAGKSATGTIHLRAFHSGNLVFIEIEDDGGGINGEAVLAKAIQNGLVTQDQASNLSEEDIYSLLFASGFSTAGQVSDLSGRGVGLDVVKTKVESLGGHVRVESRRGIGTKFSVQLPLTISIITALLVQTDSEKYAIPLSMIVETTSVRMDQVRSVHGIRTICYRNSIIPVISLLDHFKIPGEVRLYNDNVNMVVARKADKLLAIEVDEFIGQQEIVLKSLGKFLAGTDVVSGATILGDGQVALIIDTDAFFQ